MSTMIKRIPLDDLKPSPTNPRQDVPPDYIAELASTIRQHGVMQPITVCRGEIVFGHCRWQANKEALRLASIDNDPPDKLEDLGAIPSIVRDELSQEQIVEMQIIENLQRKDVSPKDEAFGYARLLEMKDSEGNALYTLEKISDRIGKTRQHVSDRLKLRFVPKELWDAYAEKKVFISHLEAVGGIPHEKKRVEAARRVLKPAYDGSAMSVAATVEMIAADFRISLRGCSFDQENAELVPVESKDGVRIMGGACTDCPHRTGNMPELADQLAKPSRGDGKGKGQQAGIDPNLCCNTQCFQAKENAAFRRTKELAENEGRRVWDVDKTAQDSVFWQYGVVDALNSGSPYVMLKDTPDHESTGHHGDEDLPTWEKLLKGTTVMKEAIMARHPKSKRVHLIIERERAIELASDNGHAKLFKNRPAPPTPRDARKDEVERKKEERKRRRDTWGQDAFRRILLEELGDKIRTAKCGGDSDLCKVICKAAAKALFDFDANTDVLMRHLGGVVDSNGSFSEADLIQAVENKVESHPRMWLEILTVTLLLMEDQVTYNGGEFGKVPGVAAAAKAMKLDMGKIKELTKAAVDQEEKRQMESELAQLTEKRGNPKLKKEELEAIDERCKELRKALKIPEPIDPAARYRETNAALHEMAKNAGRATINDQIGWILDIEEEFKLPELSEDLSEAQIAEWLKAAEIVANRKSEDGIQKPEAEALPPSGAFSKNKKIAELQHKRLAKKASKKTAKPAKAKKAKGGKGKK